MLGNAQLSPYAQFMVGGNSYIEVVIDTKEPVELGDFVSSFTSLASQYKRYMRQTHPDLREDGQVYVREVRPGSIIADLLPQAASLVAHMDQALIVENFIRIYGERLGAYFKGGRVDDASKGELKEFMGQVAAIARSKKARGAISAVTYENGARRVKACIEFDTADASRATEQIEKQKSELDRVRSADYERALMTFKRSDIGSADVGVRSGERVIIESISDRDLALIYGSPLAEERIKDQIRNTDENVYHKGFVVDVNVQTKGGRPAAYAVTHVHQIIDLDSD